MKTRLVNENFKNNYVDQLLKSRGIKNPSAFYEPGAECLQNHSDMENMGEGAMLLEEVIRLGEKILIVVDSDNDGFTSATIMYSYLKDLAPELEIDYVLHEGKQHGLQDHIDRLMEEGKHYGLIICPDSSSNDYEYHERLKEIGASVLVLDHHITDEKISDNAIIINNQLSPKYKNKELTGAGVVFQFCRYLDWYFKSDNTNAMKYMDLAALGIIGDMGSMLEIENRYIAHEGLKHINNKCFWAIARKQDYGITGKTGPSDEELIAALNPISVAFYIVPLINAMIRVGTMAEKRRLFEAFLDGDKMIPSGKRGAKGTLDKAGVEAARECSNARNRQNKILDEAVGAIEIKIHKYDLLENRVLFVRLDDDDDFPSELNGLVAMKLSAKFKRPTIVARLNKEGFNRGSMRGLNQSELVSFKDFLTESEMFEYVQGHDNAAGCSILNSHLADFHKWANDALKTIDFGENCYNVNFERIAADTDLADIICDVGDYKDIWGQQNPEPLIHVSDINVTMSDVKIMGKNMDTVKIEKFGIAYMKFHAKDLIEDLRKYSKVKLEIVGRANVNYWGGNVIPQIFIDDYEVADDTLGF
jgi:single-stranded-DNA-specific exonuclease